jgi:phosphatidylglycerol:prolipoprotein diacylglycerol transferase
MYPYLLQLGGLTLHSFGLMMALGFGGAWYAAARLGRGTHRNADFLSSLLVWMMVAGVVGARLAFVAEHWTAEFRQNPAGIFRVDRGGLMFYGGLLGALLALVLFARRRREPLLPLTDLLSAVLPLGHFFGRLGCFLNGCCFGRVSDSGLAVVFPDGSPAWCEQVTANQIGKHDHCLPVLPTQLFEAAANLVLFLVLFRLHRRASGRPGIVTAVYLMAYAGIRFGIEALRGDPRMSVGFLSIGQFISVLLFAGGGALWLWRRRAARTAPAERTT